MELTMGYSSLLQDIEERRGDFSPRLPKPKAITDIESRLSDVVSIGIIKYEFDEQFLLQMNALIRTLETSIQAREKHLSGEKKWFGRYLKAHRKVTTDLKSAKEFLADRARKVRVQERRKVLTELIKALDRAASLFGRG
jgi:hypothetical protein